MAIGTLVAGTVVYSGVGNVINAVCPTGVNPGDGLALVIGHKPGSASPNTGSASTPTGWTKRVEHLYQGGYGATSGLDTGNSSFWIFTKDLVDGTEGGTTITSTLTSTNAAYGVVIKIPTGGGLLTYGTATGQQNSTPTSPLSVTMSADPGFVAGDLALWGMTIPTDIDTPNLYSNSAITATGVTFNTGVELAEPDTTINNDLGGLVAYAIASSGTSSAAPVISATLTGTLTNVRGPLGLLRVNEGTPPSAGTTNLGSQSTSPSAIQTHLPTAGSTNLRHTSAAPNLPNLRDTHDLPTKRVKVKPEKVKNTRKKLVEDIEASIKDYFEPQPQIEAAKPVEKPKAKSKVKAEPLPEVKLDFTKAEQELKLIETQRQIDDDDADVFLLLL